MNCGGCGDPTAGCDEYCSEQCRPVEASIYREWAHALGLLQDLPISRPDSMEGQK